MISDNGHHAISFSPPLLLSSLSFLYSLPQPQEYYDEQNAAEELAGQVCMVSQKITLTTSQRLSTGSVHEPHALQPEERGHDVTS